MSHEAYETLRKHHDWDELSLKTPTELTTQSAVLVDLESKSAEEQKRHVCGEIFSHGNEHEISIKVSVRIQISGSEILVR